MNRLVIRRLLVGAALAATPVFLLADQSRPALKPVNGTDLTTAKPGRDPNQPIDEEYTKKIKEYTTETFFLSPLVDYLPASKTVPTPKVVLGDIAGAPGKLPYVKEVNEYMRLLAKATPRVKVYSIGHSEEGREMIAVAVASEALMARLDQNKADLARLADPRSMNMNDALAEEIAKRAAPVYYITGTIHAPEAGAPTALMELAYRLAVDDSPYVRNIRENLITLITPVVETDGRDRVVDLYNYRKKYPDRTVPGPIYWGKYVAHDNNRDAMAMTLKLTENVMNAFVGWKAQVLHDLHESVPYLYDNTIGDGPYNAWIDPILTNEWHLIGWNNVNEMTRMGMPGVFAFGNFDTWSPGYLMFIAATHNGISRLYETFGNGGSADTQERTLAANQTSRTWYRQNPPLPRVMWSLRNNNNYEQTGLLVSLNHFANNRLLFLRNFYEKSKRSILKAKTEGPAAYILPGNDPRPGAQAELLRILQKQHVEVSRAPAEFSAQVPVRRAAAGRGGRGGAGGGAGAGAAGGAGAGAAAEDAPPAAPTYESRQFPAGSYIIRMDQPYSRIADALLDYQYWAPNDPQSNPYDDTGWTFPEGFNVQAFRVVDPKVLTVSMETVKATVVAPGGVTPPTAASGGGATVFAVNHNADNALVTLRYQLKEADFQVAEEPFEAQGMKFNRGSFLITKVDAANLNKVATELGLKVHALTAAPSVKTHPARAARVALMHTWQSTQTEGWWRYAFDQLRMPYAYISTQEVARDTNLRAKYDVIIFAPGGGGGLQIIEGMPMFRNPMPWKNSPETPNIAKWAETDDIRPGLGWDGVKHLDDFVKQGGVFIGAVGSATFAVQFGLTHGVTTNTAATGSRVVGSLLRTRIVDDTSPIVYGVGDNLAVYSDSGGSFSVNIGGGGGGGRGGGAGTRATGRGTPDDPDTVQGRPVLDARNEAPARPPAARPWQYALPTDEQLRNPLNIIPPEFRPRVALRFADQNELLVSGLLQGGGDIAQRPVVVSVPVEKGHVVLFANNPIWRGETIGSYFMVFNTLLNFDNLNAGRKLDVK
ncbi:MAG TPA: M14 family zinc carboxypeptidase [Vicinamibacterales bacterium]|nr:M14 family zinc carboxypeptidase [Vicinamibacterales bacterium]